MKIFSGEVREIFKFSLPIILSRMSNSLGLLFSMFLIAKLGTLELASGALISSVLLCLLVIPWSILLAIGVTVGRAYGAGQYELIGKIFRQSLALGALLGVVALALLVNFGPILLFLKQDQELVKVTIDYLQSYAWGVIPAMLVVCATQLNISVGSLRVVGIFSVVSFLILVFLGIGLVFGKFGFPNLGVKGMGYANAYTYVVMLVLNYGYIFLKKGYRKFHLFRVGKRWRPYYFSELVLIGWPIGIQVGIVVFAFMFATMMMGWFGKTALAAHQIVMQASVLVVMVPYGIGQACSVLVARALGAENRKKTVLLANGSYLIGFVFSLLVALIYWIFPKALISIFIELDQGAIVQLASALFFFAAFHQMFDSFKNIAIGALRGYHDTQVPMWISSISSWGISVPLSYFLGFVLGVGPSGIWISFSFGFLIGAVILMRRFWKKSQMES